jgi:cytochrome P450
MTELPHVDSFDPEDKAGVVPRSPSENGAGTGTASEEARQEEPVDLDLGDPDFMANAYDIYADLRAKGPVSRARFAGGEEEASGDGAEEQREFFGPRETFFVTHYDEVIATLLDDRFSVDPRSAMSSEQREQMEEQPPMPEELRPLLRSLLLIDPPDHTRLRKLVQPSFTGRGMEALRGNIQQIVDDFLDQAERDAAERGEVAPDRRMDLIESFAYPFPVTVISDMLGIPREDRETIRGWTENLLRVDRGRVDEEVRAGMREFIDYLRDLFEHKREAPTDDMISRLVHVEEDGDILDEDEILATVFLMFLAGHVTTVNLIGNGVFALLTHPDQLAKVKANPELLAKGVVEETLRYWGPVDFIGRRTAREDIEVGGTVIAKGEEATVSLASANRDPERFANPDVFNIDRADANRHVAFGKGIHVCLGAPLARVEGQVAFATLF